jgi:hypothetical protein
MQAPLETRIAAHTSALEALQGCLSALHSTNIPWRFRMYRSLFPRDMFAEMDRLQRDMQQAFDLSPSIRGFGRQGFPALNVGGTPSSIEIYAFAPGMDPASLEVHLERGLLSISGKRDSNLPGQDTKACPTMPTPRAWKPSCATACCTSPCAGARRPSRAASACNEHTPDRGAMP